jgi:hypothetical protein
MCESIYRALEMDASLGFACHSELQQVYKSKGKSAARIFPPHFKARGTGCHLDCTVGSKETMQGRLATIYGRDECRVSSTKNHYETRLWCASVILAELWKALYRNSQLAWSPYWRAVIFLIRVILISNPLALRFREIPEMEVGYHDTGKTTQTARDSSTN